MAQSYNFKMHDFLACCGSSKFAAEMAKVGPFSSLSHALDTSRSIWFNKVDIPGWLEAFAAHPRIGDVDTSHNKNEKTREWSKGEQSVALKSANDSTLQELAQWNRQYEAKFGFTFLICASGRSSSEILANLKARFSNKPIDELQVAAGEQQKITELRLGKLFNERETKNTSDLALSSDLSPASFPTSSDSSRLSSDRRVGQIGAHFAGPGLDKKSDSSSQFVQARSSQMRPPITTHVLDVSCGCPAAGIQVTLEMWKGLSKGEDMKEWAAVGSSITNNDGRAGTLIPASDHVNAGRYKLTFNTGKYFSKLTSNDGNESAGGFYPYVSVIFEIKSSQVFEHFHIPVLLSPFSYTTYRGS